LHDEIVSSTDWQAIEEPMHLGGWMRVHQTLELRLQTGSRVHHRVVDFDFRRNWKECLKRENDRKAQSEAN
jgi:hypothetical protein